ncbi:alpha/beta fold hydrolase [Cupriavidus sp. 30B13]|uniref:alpha/beta fold hydrolase n=1 Tax=Cupriavidus sp. 30B13 TaxID=3384241 RepID=UPI003B913EED
MSSPVNDRRRLLLKGAAAGAALSRLAFAGTAQAAPAKLAAASQLGPLRQIDAGSLNIGYHESGPAGGPPVLLLHGYPYSVYSFVEVAPMLAARGYRVIVPHLRGHGPTRFLDSATPRSGQQAAIGTDVIALMDALAIPRAVLAGFDWGGRAACVAAALWPQRCAGLVSVNSYLIQDIARSVLPVPPQIESGLWYQYYFQTERGRAGLEAHRRDVARVIWKRNSPGWQFDDTVLDRAATVFENPDYVEVVIHSYRHRLGLAAGFPEYEAAERRLAAQPVITVPAVTLDGKTDGNYPATDGKSSASRFSGPRIHRVVEDAGHNLPEEAPGAFAGAVVEVGGMVL